MDVIKIKDTEKKQKKKAPGIDLKTATKEEIILFVRDTLKPIEIRKKLYPDFLQAARETQDKEELLRLASQTFKKVRALKQEKKKEEKKVSIVAEKESATENNSNKKKKKLINNSPVEEKITYSSSGDSVDNNNIHTPVDNNNKYTYVNYSSSLPTRVEKVHGVCVSVWESILKILKHPDTIENHELMKRITRYSKYKDVIELIDTDKIFSIHKLWMCYQQEFKKSCSNKTISSLLHDLYMDELLSFVKIEREGTIDVNVYFLPGLDRAEPVRFNRFFDRYIKHVQKSARAEKCTSKDLSEVADKVVDYNLSVRRKTMEKDLELQKQHKEQVANKKNGVTKKVTPIGNQEEKNNLKDPSHRDSFDMEFYKLTQKLSKEQLDKNLQNKRFQAAYNKMQQQIKEMTKEEFDSILRLEELKRKKFESGATL
nr:MAG: hypothetical protein [uncultured archaeon]BDI55240.1 MAG: hypothetical protein [uncultured archaeon]